MGLLNARAEALDSARNIYNANIVPAPALQRSEPVEESVESGGGREVGNIRNELGRADSAEEIKKIKGTAVVVKREIEVTRDIALVFPPPSLCTDNGLMVAWAGVEKLYRGISDSIEEHQEPTPRWPIGEPLDDESVAILESLRNKKIRLKNKSAGE